MRLDEDERPEVLGARSFAGSIAVHLAFFLLIWIAAKATSRPKETVMPIDLLVVVNENLDGKENEPPPVQEPPKETPKPQPPQPVKEEPPKEPEKVEAVEVVQEKPKVDHIKRIRDAVKNKEEPPKEKPKVEPPKKTREELIRERMKGQPTKANVTIKVNAPSGDGKTGKKTLSDAEIKKMLGEGYKPGAVTQLAASEEQRCISLIRDAFYSKWNRPPYHENMKEMYLKVVFGPGGRVLSYKLVQSSGDGAADRSVQLAAALVKVVPGLSEEFLRKNREGIEIRFKVTSQ